MSSRSSDFNYKVALASGLKSLQGGRLRQAEEQFRYLVQHFRSADGGYRGLAKVLVEQQDRPGALRTLLEGGAALAKADQRAAAIALYREAVALEPLDLSAHRRLAAALTNAGDVDEAAREFIRFTNAALNANDRERAGSEATYALERLPGNTEISELARYAGADVAPAMPHRVDAPILSSDDRAAMLRSAFGMPTESTAQFDLTSAVEPKAETETPTSHDTTISAEPKASPWDTQPPSGPLRAATPAPPAADSWTAAAPTSATAAPTGADPWATPEAGAAQIGPSGIDAHVEAQSVEASAAAYLASGDPRGAEHALEAARRYIAEGRTDAASDLLLQLVASGIATHEAQRLLVDVARTLGKRDVAKAKVELLVEALRLDGRMDLAAEVEQQAEAS